MNTKPFIENFKNYRLSLLQGYVTAWCEEGKILSMVLLKYFEKELKEEWHREADIVQRLSCGEEPHAKLLHYRWHSKGKQPSTKSIYLAYTYVSCICEYSLEPNALWLESFTFCRGKPCFFCLQALSISVAPFTEPEGSQGKLYRTFMLYVLLDILCLALIIICCSPACDQKLEHGEEQIRALHSNSL